MFIIYDVAHVISAPRLSRFQCVTLKNWEEPGDEATRSLNELNPPLIRRVCMIWTFRREKVFTKQRSTGYVLYRASSEVHVFITQGGKEI